MRGQKLNKSALGQALSPGKGELVCACGDPKEICDICNRGLLQEVRRGKGPQLKKAVAAGPGEVVGAPPPLPDQVNVFTVKV